MANAINLLYYMNLSNDFLVTNNSGNTYLVNIVSGDVFSINDVVETIIQLCPNFNTIRCLAEEIFNRFQCEDDDFGFEDLVEFITDMVKQGILVE